jgi:hypothetical protein
MRTTVLLTILQLILIVALMARLVQVVSMTREVNQTIEKVK